MYAKHTEPPLCVSVCIAARAPKSIHARTSCVASDGSPRSPFPAQPGGRARSRGGGKRGASTASSDCSSATILPRRARSKGAEGGGGIVRAAPRPARGTRGIDAPRRDATRGSLLQQGCRAARNKQGPGGMCRVSLRAVTLFIHDVWHSSVGRARARERGGGSSANDVRPFVRTLVRA